MRPIIIGVNCMYNMSHSQKAMSILEDEQGKSI